MKIFIYIIMSFCIFFSISNADEKKDCKQFKKFTKERIACIGNNLKNIVLKGKDKVKKDVNIAANDIKEDVSKVKVKTGKLIEKGKDKFN